MVKLSRKTTRKKQNLQYILDKIYKKLKGRYSDSKNADYIPILKNMDSNIFQISVFPVKNNSYGFKNKIHSVGEFVNKNGENIEVSLQSISKVFNLALAIKVRNYKNQKNNRTGIQDLLEYIGTEESFMGFNDIKAHKILNGKQGVPFTINPFINAGAITTVSFITPKKNTSTLNQMLDNINSFSGINRKGGNISLSTFESEMRWLQTNTKLAKYLKKVSEKNYKNNDGNIKKIKYFQGDKDTLDIKSALTNYTTICSMLVNSEELVDMTYTLANKGVNSVGEKILSCEENKYILSALIFGGMYNASGQWFQKLGIPMKSGVGGGIIIIPLLMLFIGLDQRQAQGTSLAVMLPPIGILAAINYHKSGFIDWKFAMIIAAAFIVGGYFGSRWAVTVDARMLKKIFGVIMLIGGLKLIFR